MSNYYLLFLPQEVIRKNASHEQSRINLNVTDMQVQVDDSILLVSNQKGSILPFVYTVTYVNRSAGTLTLQQKELHNRAISWGEVLNLLDNRSVLFASSGTANLSGSSFEQIIGKMGGKRMEEKALLEHIQSYIRARGYYFSQFLSAMEGERADERQIRLYGKRMQKQLEEQDKTPTLPAQLSLPDNLFFTGTINVDETTQSISDKVIDRANTLEFFNIDLDKMPQPTTPPDSVPLSTYTWQSYRVSTPDTSYRAQIIEISKILNKADLGLGYRVLHEIELYLANGKELLAPLVAFDLQVKQRILPRIRGNEAISDMLKELQNYLKQNKLERSQKRLQEMEKRLKRDGYTNFWR